MNKRRRKRDGTLSDVADLGKLRDEIKKQVHHVLEKAGVSKEVLDGIPFAFTSIDDTFVPPECGPGQRWREQLLTYMLQVIKAWGLYALDIELKQRIVSKFWKDHPYVASTGSLALCTALPMVAGLLAAYILNQA